MPRAGFITGLKSEADCLAAHTDSARIRIAGMRPDAAEQAARDLVDDGCDLLVSFGLAGALVASLAPGQVIVAGEVATAAGESYATNKALSAEIRARIPAARSGSLAGHDGIVASVRGKIALNQRTGAVAVDMESHRIARLARERGVSFLAIRVIADRLESTIPRAAFDAIDAEGRPRASVVLTGLARRPWEIVGLAILAAQSRAAHRSLRDVAPLLFDRLVG